MKNKPLLLTGFAVSLALAPAAAWAGAQGDRGDLESGSGGALAIPLLPGPGGGTLAPEGLGEAEGDGEAEAAQAGEAPEALAGQEPTPTAPEGEQQPASEQEEEGQAGSGEEGADPAEAQATADEAGAAAESAGDSLPTTGLGLAALAAVGLGLVLGGLALRPRRRV
jgi:hypothetical protein